MEKYTMNEMRKIILESKSKSEACNKIYGYCNGRISKKLDIFIIDNNINHFEKLKYENNPKKCKNCEKIIIKDKKANNFCNSICSATFNNKGRIMSNESKEKTKKSMKQYYIENPDKLISKYRNTQVFCKECNKELTLKQKKKQNIFCSLDCCKKNENYREKLSNSMQERIKKGLHKGWQSRNILSPEKFFIKVLENNNIKYEPNKSINKKKDLGLDEPYSYFLDFFIEDKKIDLEIDGSQHTQIERIESDKKRDYWLSKNGYKVYRIKWKNINTKNGKNYIKNEIDKFLKFYENN
jgi:Protein of unknown function (DUF559)